MNKPFHKHYHSPWKRALFSFALIFVVMFVGTLGMHYFEKMSYLEAYYFTSMIATAQGPFYVPQSVAGKIFVSILSFISVGVVVAATAFLFGPFFGKLLRVGFEKFEHELELLKHRKDKS